MYSQRLFPTSSYLSQGLEDLDLDHGGVWRKKWKKGAEYRMVNVNPHILHLLRPAVLEHNVTRGRRDEVLRRCVYAHDLDISKDFQTVFHIIHVSKLLPSRRKR